MKNEKPSGKVAPGEQGPTRAVQYLYANLAWYAFLGLVAVATYLATGRVWDDVISDAFEFLFLILGGGFTFATLLDIVYERVYAVKGAGEKP